MPPQSVLPGSPTRTMILRLLNIRDRDELLQAARGVLLSERQVAPVPGLHR